MTKKKTKKCIPLPTAGMAQASYDPRVRIEGTQNKYCEFWVDAAGNFVNATLSCERMTGYLGAEFKANPYLFLRIVHPDHRRRFGRYIKKYFKSIHVCRSDFKIITRNGEERWLTLTSQPLFDEYGELVGRRCFHWDITVRKLAEIRRFKSLKTKKLSVL